MRGNKHYTTQNIRIPILTIFSINFIDRIGMNCKYVTHHVGSKGAPSRRTVLIGRTSTEQWEFQELLGGTRRLTLQLNRYDPQRNVMETIFPVHLHPFLLNLSARSFCDAPVFMPSSQRLSYCTYFHRIWCEYPATTRYPWYTAFNFLTTSTINISAMVTCAG
jgi:hypothetical protein